MWVVCVFFEHMGPLLSRVLDAFLDRLEEFVSEFDDEYAVRANSIAFRLSVVLNSAISLQRIRPLLTSLCGSQAHLQVVHRLQPALVATTAHLVLQPPYFTTLYLFRREQGSLDSQFCSMIGDTACSSA